MPMCLLKHHGTMGGGNPVLWVLTGLKTDVRMGPVGVSTVVSLSTMSTLQGANRPLCRDGRTIGKHCREAYNVRLDEVDARILSCSVAT